MEDSLDPDSGDLGEPGSGQVPGDQQLQVDGLEDLDVRRSFWSQRGSETHSHSGSCSRL